MKLTRTITLLILCALFVPIVAVAQIDDKTRTAFAAIRKEGMERSEIMKTLHVYRSLRPAGAGRVCGEN